MSTIYQPPKNILIAKSPLAGTEIFKEFLIAQFKAFPDFQAKIEHIIAERDLVVVFLNFTGTHKGEFRGMPSTNQRVNITSADLYKIENEKDRILYMFSYSFVLFYNSYGTGYAGTEISNGEFVTGWHCCSYYYCYRDQYYSLPG